MNAEVREQLAQLARSGRTDELLRLIGEFGGVDAHDRKGDSVLMLAAYHGHVETVRALLRAGADPAKRNVRGLTPLDGAAFKGDVAVVEALVEGGAPVDEPGPDGRTALMWAAAFNRSEVTQALLRRGASVTKTDQVGNTARTHAQQMGAWATQALLEPRRFED